MISSRLRIKVEININSILSTLEVGEIISGTKLLALSPCCAVLVLHLTNQVDHAS